MMRAVSKVLDVLLWLGLMPVAFVAAYGAYDGLSVSHSAVISGDIIKLAEAHSDGLFETIDSEYVIAWLTVDETNISYPVVQGMDNNWFLNRNYKGEHATAGSIFLDYRNAVNFSDRFSIAYGHRMGGGEMFSDIQKFKDKDYFEAHRWGSLRLRAQEFILEIVAYAEVDANDWGIYNVEKTREAGASAAVEKTLGAAI